MTRNDILEQLKQVFTIAVGDDVDVSKVNEDASLTDDLGLNSVGILYVVVAIEEQFGIEFDELGFSDFTTVKSVIDYIEQKIS